MVRRLSIVVVALLGLGIAGAFAPVAAQICGDADGSGAVTVTDGVLTLRAAAGLDSSCTDAVCDVDGSGAVTVTDGVNVLRTAAALPAADECVGAAGQPATVLSELVPLFSVALPYATGTKVTACANDGTVEDFPPDEDGVDTAFSFCQVGNVEFDGDIIVGPALFTLSVLEIDTADANEDFIASYDGELTLGTSGAGKSLNGTLDVDTDSAGDFLPLTFASTVITGTQLTSGTASLDLSDSNIVDQFTRLDFTFDGSGTARVQATQSNGSTSSFRFNLTTGEVTPQ